MGLESLHSANANKFPDSEDEADLSRIHRCWQSLSWRMPPPACQMKMMSQVDWSDDSDGDEKAAVDGEAPLGEGAVGW